MLALEMCRSGATDQEILDWFNEATPEVRKRSVEELRYLRDRTGTMFMDDETMTVACLCAADDPQETYELITYQRAPVERRDLIRRLVHRRTRPWCDRFARIATTATFGGTWWLIRLMILEGLIERPGGHYLGLMVGRIVTHPYYTQDGPRVVAALRQDPGLLEAEVWEVLAKPCNLGPAWLSALVELADEGYRDRLLDAGWRTLVADCSPVDQTWFLDLLKQLQPSTDELASRLTGLLRMTASDSGSVALWALAGLRDLFEAGRVELDDLLAIRAPLQRRDKRTAWAHLALLERTAKRCPSRGSEVAETVAVALEHQRRDVRERAQRILERVAPDAAAARAPAEVRSLELKAKTRPAPAPFEPLQSAQELVELLLTMMAMPGSAIDVERAFDGAMRFKHDISESGRTALDQGSQAGSGQSVYAFGAHTLARALVKPLSSSLGDASWTEGVYDNDQHSTDVRERSLQRMTKLRLEQIRMAIHSPITQLLSTPTSNDGTLALEALRERLRSTRGAPAFRSDLGAAAFRIAPEDYGALRTICFGTMGEWIAADVKRIAGHRHQWEAVAWYANNSYDDGANHRGNGHAEGPGIIWQDAAPEPAPANEFVGSVLDRRRMRERAQREWAIRWPFADLESLTGSWSLLLPHHRELHAAHAFPLVAATLETTSPIFGQLILSLGEGRQLTGPIVASALACALPAERVEHRGAAVDAMIELATYGLLDGAELGRQIVRLLAEEHVVGSRIATALAEAGRALGPYSGPVLDAHVQLLPVLRQRRDGHAFAETTADLATSLGRRVVLPPEMAELAAGRSSSALARAARRIPKHI